jgi:ROS/MUCR transcriptional regulator protein
MYMEKPYSPPGIDRGGYIVAGGEQGEQAMSAEEPTELVAKIVGAYLRRNQIPPDQLALLISNVHQALGRIGKPAEAVDELYLLVLMLNSHTLK